MSKVVFAYVAKIVDVQEWTNSRPASRTWSESESEEVEAELI